MDFTREKDYVEKNVSQKIGHVKFFTLTLNGEGYAEADANGVEYNKKI